MRDTCMLPFTKEQITMTGEYCRKKSSTLPVSILEQIKFTDQLHKDEVVMAPSESQCSWLLSFTRALRPKRILELGTFTGVSALVFYEATKEGTAEIVSMDMSEKYLEFAQDAFRRYGADERIKTVQGPCLDMLPTLTGQFDLVYIDAAEEEYESYTRYILDHKLLSPNGVILVDDVLLEGLVIDSSIARNFPEEIQEPYLAIADRMDAFNRYAVKDPRVTTTMIPLFNGVTQIMWK
ncbi:putative O-methyltransferase [Penicillium brasilianum]|uniref:Putative O-methyltransferase n=1 Tax=Penicillium brasilianum TaxID=104259 RepID=A0A1S9RYP9_PENBI|nr:putative O-methyltransferase [Penicillium brasilianum]